MPEVLKPLMGLTIEELTDVARKMGAAAFVGKQMADWIYKKHVCRIDDMRNLPKKLQERLKEEYTIGNTAPVDAQRSVDGTIKYLYATHNGKYIETVYIPDGDRATLCVSTQVGCKMKCAFCMTGRQGYAASLTATDILNQVYSLPERTRLTNIVFMGQGEPFDNLDNVLRTTHIMTSEWGYGWSPKRITVSSVGLPDGLRRFLKESSCHIAISLHHPIPAERAKLMPIEKAFSIKEVVQILQSSEFYRKPGQYNNEHARQRRLSFEYIVFAGINDSIRHADALLALLEGLDCRINLIRFHSIPDTPLQGVDDDHMLQFRDYLTAHGLFTTIRASRGQDIFAACGLLSTAKQSGQRQ